MKPFYYSLIVFGFGSLVLSPQVKAQSATADGQSTYGQLAGFVSQIAVLKAQAQVVQLQQQIAEAKREAAAANDVDEPVVPAAPSLPAPPYSGLLGRPQVPSSLPPAQLSGLGDSRPQILSISGVAGQLSALLLMPGGSQVEAVPGTPLDNGSVVRFVSPQSVQVLQNGKIIALPFAGGNASAPGG